MDVVHRQDDVLRGLFRYHEHIFPVSCAHLSQPVEVFIAHLKSMSVTDSSCFGFQLNNTVKYMTGEQRTAVFNYLFEINIDEILVGFSSNPLNMTAFHNFLDKVFKIKAEFNVINVMEIPFAAVCKIAQLIKNQKTDQLKELSGHEALMLLENILDKPSYLQIEAIAEGVAQEGYRVCTIDDVLSALFSVYESDKLQPKVRQCLIQMEAEQLLGPKTFENK